jgi:hypothetical protein
MPTPLGDPIRTDNAQNYRGVRPFATVPRSDDVGHGQDGPDDFLLDFHGIDYVSSDFLVSLVRLRRNLEAAGKQLSLCNLSPPVAEVFAVTGLGRFFDIRPDQPEEQPEPVLRVGFQ